jgi:hypothetical protein
MIGRGLLVTLALLSLTRAVDAVEATSGHSAGFALIIGVNQSVDRDARPLRYADDDAARYRDLFRALGVRTYLLATLDENTRRLHPEAAAESIPPRAQHLREVIDRLVSDVRSAQGRGEETTLYVIYAGHGNVDGRTGYITLEDRRLTGPELSGEVFDRVKARRSHLIVDACSSYLLVSGRGQGGERRPLHGFAGSPVVGGDLLGRGDIGLLLSTSSARESHEWNAFQAGVFSHEVRSGMFGGADADGDGTISYAEIAAFIRRANESIPNERYRPEVFWRPPADRTTLVDLRSALARRVEIPATEHGHYYLEDPRGVRLADFHNGSTLTARLIRPSEPTHLYLQRTGDQRAFLLPGSVAVLDTARLSPEDTHVGVRSAAHEAFSALFALPFDRAAVAETAPPLLVELAEAPPAPGMSARRTAGWGLLGAAALATAGGAAALLSARALHDEIGPRTSQRDAVEINQRVGARNRLAGAGFGIAGAAAFAGAALLLWPKGTPVSAAISDEGVLLGLGGGF